MSADYFTEHMASLVKEYITNNDGRTSIEPLLFALGCATIKNDQTFSYIKHPPKLPAACEHQAQAILSAASRYVATETCYRPLRSLDGSYILCVVASLDRFFDGLQDVDASYDIAILLHRFANDADNIFKIPSGADMPPEAQVEIEYFTTICAPLVANLLNTWLLPQTPFATDCSNLSAKKLRRNLFGNLWCDLILDLHARPDYESLIRSLRPNFMPELLSQQRLSQSQSLPSLDLQ